MIFLEYNIDMDWQPWIYQKYLDFRGDTRRGVSEFSSWLGVSQPTVSAWINGTRGAPTSRRIINALILKYGESEVYDVLGMGSPESVRYDQLPRRLKQRLDAAMKEINAQYEERGITDPESEAAAEVAAAVLGRYGFDITIEHE